MPEEMIRVDSRKGKKYTEEEKAVRYAYLMGENNYWYGKKHSDETKAKQSAAHIGKKMSAETRQKMSDAAKNRVCTNLQKYHHTRWHVERNIVKETCELCMSEGIQDVSTAHS